MAVKQKQKEKPSGKPAAPVEESSSELKEPRWSVVSFETVAAGSLTYTDAEQKLRELEAEKVSGLCIVTDEAAARISK